MNQKPTSLRTRNGNFLFNILFIFFVFDLSAQYYQGNSVPYDISNGLPHNEINDIIKDKNGFVWIATENGLSRFDGYNFVNFNSESHPAIFKDNKINSLQQQGAYLYLLTKKDGLIRLDTKQLIFTKLSTSTPLSLSFSGDTTVILYNSGIITVNIKNKRITTHNFKVSPQDNLVLYKGYIYLSRSDQGIIKFSIFQSSKHTNIKIPGAEKFGKLLISKKYGIIHHNGNLVRIIKNGNLIDHPEFAGKNQISFFNEDYTGSSIYIQKHSSLNVKFDGENIGLLYGFGENYHFNLIYRVSENCILAGSNQGIIKISKNPSFVEKINDYSNIKENEIIVRRSILENQDKRYFLNYPYIIEQGNTITNITNKPLPFAEGIIYGNELYSVTDGNGLISVNLSTKKITNHSCNVIHSTESFESISFFSDSLLLLAGGNKIVLFNPKTTKGDAYFLKKGINIHVAIQKKKSETIYLGTSHGVFQLKYTKNKRFVQIQSNIDKRLDIRDILLLNNKNQIWLATNNGVHVLNMTNLKFNKSYANPKEISHPKVVKLLLDNNNCIWASTYSGITVFNLQNSSIRFLNKNHGLNNTEFNYRSGKLLQDGNLIFGGLNAYDLINYKLLSEFTYSTSFIISGIETIRKKDKNIFSNYSEHEIIKLTTDEAIIIHLANFDFQFGKGYMFQYSIDSKNWFNTDNKQTFLLSNLAYGDYVLKIRMFNPFGQLVEEKKIQVQVNTYFYYKPGFYALIIILIVLLSALFILFLIRSIRVKTKTRSKIAMDLHDESGTILTRLLLLSKKEKFEEQDRERLKNGLKEALYNFRTYLDVLSRKKHSWQDLTDEIQEFINQICTDANVAYEFINDFDEDQIIKRELFRDIKLTTYEVITNSLKYSQSKTLTIHFKLKENNFKMIISDLGIFHVTDLDERKGNGLRNIKKRVTRNKGNYSYNNTSELGGITVEINIPIK